VLLVELLQSPREISVKLTGSPRIVSTEELVALKKLENNLLSDVIAIWL
jgi:hypothetical protein